MIGGGLAGGLVLAFYIAGLTVMVLAALSTLALRRVYPRLHFLTPMTSLGAPLIAVALGIQNGWGLTTGEILLIIGVLALTGPVLEAATGRVKAQTDGLLSKDSPE
jgi:multisubunit Na+/H+ antiporter MnhG subunit